jgi:hypothetical protein
MDEIICTTAVPQTAQELDEAVRTYHKSDLKGDDLYCQWTAIRQAALQQSAADVDPHPIPGIDSY